MRKYLLLLALLAIRIPAFASAPLSFDSALSIILERHTGLQSQKEKKESVEARNWSSKYSLLPSVSLIGSDTITHDVDASENSDKRFYGVSASLNILHFGSDISAMLAAHHENEAQSYLLDQALLTAEEDGIKTLIQVIQAQNIVKSLEQNLKTRAEAVKIGKERYKRGLFAEQEVDKLAIDHDNVNAQLQDAQTDLIGVKAKLKSLLEQDNVQLDWPWMKSMANLGKKFENESKVNLTERPDWKAAVEQEDAAHARKRQYLGLALPSLDLNVNYGNADYRIPTSTSRNGTEWQGLLTLTIPLFDRLASLGNYRAQVHAAKSAELEKERIKRLAEAEWTSTKDAFLVAYRSAEARERTLETTRKLYEVNAARFRRGLINANELMIDQERLYQSELNSIKGWSEAHLRAMSACHAMGKRIIACF